MRGVPGEEAATDPEPFGQADIGPPDGGPGQVVQPDPLAAEFVQPPLQGGQRCLDVQIAVAER